MPSRLCVLALFEAFSFRLSLHLFQVRLGAGRDECLIEALSRGSNEIAYAKCTRRLIKVLVLQNDEEKVREKESKSIDC